MMPVRRQSPGFFAGCTAGMALSLGGLWVTGSAPALLAADTETISAWVDLNLGTSVWFFAAVLAVFVAQLTRLRYILDRQETHAAPSEVARLDQLLDVWVQVFVGIGVVWTAIGMRSALQSALADPGSALTDTAGNVLRDLVDGGILLALSTTIVGAIGGYLMRITKTAMVGADLAEFYLARERSDVSELLAATQRIEHRLNGGHKSDAASPSVDPHRLTGI